MTTPSRPLSPSAKWEPPSGKKHDNKRHGSSSSDGICATLGKVLTGEDMKHSEYVGSRVQVEPALMERHHMLPEDEALRSTDVPERLQLARGRDLQHFDSAAAAECASIPCRPCAEC